jgi:hypothetical protein
MIKTGLIIAILLAGFVYVRGEKAVLEKRGLDCQWRAVVAVCTAKGDKKASTAAKQPSLQEIFQAGIKF